MKILLLAATGILVVRVTVTFLGNRNTHLRERVQQVVPYIGQPAEQSEGPVCVLLHGWATTPAELLPLAKALTDAGFVVYSPWLPDHGTNASAIERGDPDQWSEELAAMIRRLRTKHSRVFLVGQSLGGTIALDLTAAGLSDGTVCINPFLHVKRYVLVRTETFIPVLTPALPYAPFIRAMNMSAPSTRELALAAPMVPLRQVPVLSGYARRVLTKLDGVTSPTLFVVSDRDMIVDPSSTTAFRQALTRSNSDEIVLPRSAWTSK